MKYRQERTAEVLKELEGGGVILGGFSDLLHGLDYIKTCQRGDIQPNDTVVMFSIDGA